MKWLQWQWQSFFFPFSPPPFPSIPSIFIATGLIGIWIKFNECHADDVDDDDDVGVVIVQRNDVQFYSFFLPHNCLKTINLHS